MSKPTPRLLKGFRDFLPQQKTARDFVENKVIEAFARFGFQPLETPTLEYASLLLGKYGEEADRLVYAFEDNGGRDVAMPYDQTVPSARVLAQYQRELPRFFRRYAIRNVFRAERPQKGRYREFKQCDIDIFGSSSPIADAEIVACTYSAFDQVGFKTMQIKINDRQILTETLGGYATGAVDVLSIIRSVDKLDKIGDQGVVAELAKKGLEESAAEEALQRIASATPSENLTQILEAIDALGVPSSAIQFSPVLARGLDYYTGAIFEVEVPEFSAGSLGGGGRYDNLIQQLGGPPTPSVGIAFGFDRMVDAATELGLLPEGAGAAQVLVTIFDTTSVVESLKVASDLRHAGVCCEVYAAPDKMGRQLKVADQKRIPWVTMLGPDELENSEVTLRNMRSGDQSRIPRSELAQRVTQLIRDSQQAEG